jgi:excisionase family DNA binding protein
MKLLSVPDVADVLGVSQKKVWSMVYSHEVDAVRIGRSVRIPESSLAELIQRNMIPAQVA